MTLKVTFHIGKPKTATTLLQRIGQQVTDAKFLGIREVNLQKDKTNEVYKHHLKIFPVRRKNVIAFAKTTSEVHENELQEYGDYITHSLRNIKTQNKHVIISDEAILDYHNHSAKNNISNLRILIDLIRAEFKGQDLDVNISVTIRRQDRWMWSFFHHHREFSGSFENFVNEHIKTNEDILGLDYYTMYLELKDLIGDLCNINFIPYEVLGIDTDIHQYVRSCFSTPNFEFDYDSKNKINDKALENSPKQMVPNRFSTIGKLGYKLSGYNNARHTAAVPKLISCTSKFLLKLESYTTPEVSPVNTSPPKKISRAILLHYQNSNMKLASVFPKYDFERYRYYDNSI